MKNAEQLAADMMQLTYAIIDKHKTRFEIEMEIELLREKKNMMSFELARITGLSQVLTHTDN